LKIPNPEEGTWQVRVSGDAKQAPLVLDLMARGIGQKLTEAWGQPVIVDVHDGAGPIAGIAAAQAAHPDCAWLVLACDLPFVDDAAIGHLVGHRDGRSVVAYASSHDGLPEPLCAIYEPASRAGVLAALASGRNCPRKFIVGTGVALLRQPDPAALDNVNTPEELQRARGHLGGPATP
jgi:molybdopterin-guanine dinucleotide biosynthesis protein A